MNPKLQRIAIAKACGLSVVSDGITHCLTPCHLDTGKFDPQGKGLTTVPDYLNDLNAMHAALKSQTQAFRAEFDRLLHAIAEEKHLLVTELETKDWADCFISCLQSQRDSGNSTP